MIHVLLFKCIQLVNGYLGNKRASPGYAIAPQDKPIMRIGFINFYLTDGNAKVAFFQVTSKDMSTQHGF